MNRYVARVFSDILALLHFVVIVMLSIFLYEINYKKSFASLEYLGISSQSLNFLAIFLFFSYAIFMGTISTFVSINENLEKIVELNKNMVNK